MTTATTSAVPASTAAEPGPQIARFKELPVKSKTYSDSDGIPPEAYEAVSAKTLYLVMAPEGAKGSNKNPPIKGTPGLTVQIAHCPPGNGPVMHRHAQTVETFMCLQGSFEVKWGVHGEHNTQLGLFDVISVPPSEYRAFKNTGDTDALLLVLIQGGNEQLADVTFSQDVGDMIAGKFGGDVKKKLEAKLGWIFSSPQ